MSFRTYQNFVFVLYLCVLIITERCLLISDPLWIWQAQAIGKAASDFIQQELNMDYVYDYMFQLLNEYSKLLRFEPKVPKGAVELCSETMACGAEGSEKRFMMESLVKGPSVSSPCTLPPPYEPQELGAFVKRKANAMKRVETWEKKYWEGLHNKQQ